MELPSTLDSINSLARESADDPDVDTIEFLCTVALSNHTLNRDLLLNWQVELSDISQDHITLSSVANELVLVQHKTFLGDENGPTRECFRDLFNRLNNLDDEVYHDLKSIILEVLIHVAQKSVWNRVELHKLQLHEVAIEFLLEEKLQQQTPQLSRLVVCLLELGCSILLLRRIIVPLYNKETSPRLKLALSELLNQIFTRYPSQASFLLIQIGRLFSGQPGGPLLPVSLPVALPVFREFQGKTFTAQFWFRIEKPYGEEDEEDEEEEENKVPLFLLAASSGHESSLFVEISNHQITIVLRGDKSGARMQFSFNQLLRHRRKRTQSGQTSFQHPTRQGNSNVEGSSLEFAHISLTYDTYKNLNLFVDGEYSESMPCPEIYRVMHTWNKVYIGGDNQTVSDIDLTTRTELIIRQLTVLNQRLSPAWISLIYNLGMEYLWDYKDFTEDNIFNLLNQLLFKAITNLALKVRELRGNHQPNSTPTSTILRKPHHQNNTSVMIDRSRIAQYLLTDRIQQEDVVFDTCGNALVQHIIVDISNTIHGAFFSIGGTGLLLRLIELHSTKHYSSTYGDLVLYKILTLLFTLLNSNWRLAREFEDINGYGVLLVLLTQYKERVNPDLELSLGTDPNAPKVSVLQLLLRNAGYSIDSPHDSLVINPTLYKTLVLNFELYSQSPLEFATLLGHFRGLLTLSKYQQVNALELVRLKVVNRFIQFLKTETYVAPDEKLLEAFQTIMEGETSVETIRSVSLFIIFLLYSKQERNVELGVMGTKVLTSILCDNGSSVKVLKKFSRSITIHWILLLLSYRETGGNIHLAEITKCGIRLLVKLLRVLGPHIIRRFFQVNHGSDILTHFLKDLWHDDKIISLIYLAAFGETRCDKPITKILSSSLLQLLMPEFLMVLCNLALISTYLLNLERSRSQVSSPIRGTPISANNSASSTTKTLNVVNFLNLYIEIIQSGIEDPRLVEHYRKKEWLDRTFELAGHLKILNQKQPVSSILPSNVYGSIYDKLINTLASIFISEILNTQRFFKIFSSLSDFTKKLALHTIFPKIFQHVNQFTNVLQFIFNEKEFMDATVELLNFYIVEFIHQGYLVDFDDLDVFITCALSVLEIGADRQSSGSKRLKSRLGDVIIGWVAAANIPETQMTPPSSPIVSTLPSTPPSKGLMNPGSPNELIPLSHVPVLQPVSALLYRLVLILQPEVLSDQNLSDLISVLLGNFLKMDVTQQKSASDLLFNFLRTSYLVRQDSFATVVKFLSASDNHESSSLFLHFFLDTIITRNDEETSRFLQRHPTIPKILTRNFQMIMGKVNEKSHVSIMNMISAMADGGGTTSNVFILTFERDCELLKVHIINGEIVKFNRGAQDQHEATLHCVSTYNALKFEISRLTKTEDYLDNAQFVLDYIEGSDRIRKRMVIEDQLAESEKLSYNIAVPVRLQDSNTNDLFSVDEIEYEASERISSMSIKDFPLDDVDIDGTESFELVDSEGNPESELATSSSVEDKNRKVVRSLYMGDRIVNLWNISQINGLAPIESLLILGQSHLYIIENYFHRQDNGGGVVDINDAPLELRDPYLQLVNSQTGSISGLPTSHHRKAWSLENLGSISKRQFLLRDVALEMFFSDGASILITCLSSKERDAIYSTLGAYAKGQGLDSDLALALQSARSVVDGVISTGNSNGFAAKVASAFSSANVAVATGTSSFFASALEIATTKWKMGQMSNFYYLMIINTLAGRTFNDLTQYPVFPWVIADYTSDTLDLSDPKSFRDLSKPMGAQTPDRAAQFRERYEALDSFDQPDNPAFHYGTHYSSAMIVTSFLIRLKPYVQSYLLLQGGKFDHADRLFNSIERAWKSASQDNTTDVRELTPEFFYLPEFLVNNNNFEFGKLQHTGEVMNDVSLPPWAHGDPKVFVEMNRQALESPYVSQNLHSWIDLVFGYKQLGPEAVNALNVFHHLSYNGAINLDNIKDEMEKRAVIGTINNFGQTPVRMFSRPHVVREILNLPNLYLTIPDSPETPVFSLVFESKMRVPIKKIEILLKTRKIIGRPGFVVSEDDLLIRKASWGNGSLIINTTVFLNIHLAAVVSMLQVGNRTFLTGLEDGVINVWRCYLRHKAGHSTSRAVGTSATVSLENYGILRGHFSSVSDLRFSSSFKVALSRDIDGVVMLWDLARFKFIRRITQGNVQHIAISNDTGTIAVICDDNHLELYTINGELIYRVHTGLGDITSLCFGSVSGAAVTDYKRTALNSHVYWSCEIIGIGYGHGKKDDVENDVARIDIYEFSCGLGWTLKLLRSLDLSNSGVHDPTTIEIRKQVDTDSDEKLSRGSLYLLVGDSTGRIYLWK